MRKCTRITAHKQHNIDKHREHHVFSCSDPFLDLKVGSVMSEEVTKMQPNLPSLQIVERVKHANDDGDSDTSREIQRQGYPSSFRDDDERSW